MKNLLFTVVFVAMAICASAQKVYFIYLQADNNASFYVKMNDKIYSSAASGYLILSNLVDSTYTFSIGFPPSQSESRFTVRLNARDKGFLIKDFDTGLGLFDLQNFTIINQQKDDSPKNISYTRRYDDFSSLLSKAANDTSLLYAVVRTKEEDVAIQEPQLKSEELRNKTEETTLKDSVVTEIMANTTSETKKPDTLATVQTDIETKKEANGVVTAGNETLQKDSTAVVASGERSSLLVTDSLTGAGTDSLANKADIQTAPGDTIEAINFKKSQVKKHSESSTSEGFGLVFYDTYDGGRDTIRLLIPNPPIVFRQSVEGDSSEIQKDFIHVEELKKDTVQQAPIVVAPNTNSPSKSQCKSVASDNDFFKLRRNMAAKTTDDGMVEEAKKLFKTKCFTTEQIKNLGALFLTSAGKYQFFDAAYLHVSDQENFSSLESEIKDDYYLKRFKALIGE